MMRRSAAAMVCVVMLAACGANPAPPTKVGTIGEENGVRLRIELDEPTLTAGVPAGAMITITNTGADLVTWAVDGCRVIADLRGSAGTWRPGRDWDEPDAARVKARMLEARQAGDGIAIRFLPDDLAAGVGPGLADIGCRDVAVILRLEPGESMTQHQVWPGLVDATWAPPPSGPVALIGRIAELRRGEADAQVGFLVSAELRTTIDGPDRSPKVHPGEAIDVALDDPEFGKWLRGQARSGAPPVLEYEPTEGLWRVGMAFPGQSHRRYAFVDATTGALRGWADEIRD